MSKTAFNHGLPMTLLISLLYPLGPAAVILMPRQPHQPHFRCHAKARPQAGLTWPLMAQDGVKTLLMLKKVCFFQHSPFDFV